MARRGQEIELNMEDIEETPIPSEARCWKKRSGHGALRLPGLVNVQKAIENCPFIVDLPIKNGDVPWLC